MNVLFIATRAPYGKMHGHKMGIRTYISALKGLGHQVVLAAFEVPGDGFEVEDLGIPNYYLPLPARSRVAWNLLRFALGGRKSLNECLYHEPRLIPWIRDICTFHSIDFVVADMIRTAPYAEAAGVPWMLDHEDLLSERYRMWASRSSGDENILGYLSGYVPSVLQPASRWVFRATLSREARVLERRETYWADRAPVNSLVSHDETARLQARSRQRVFCMPVTVPVPPAAASDLARRPMSAVFTGGLTYQPNLDALRAYVGKVLPAFARLGVVPPVLSVIGAAPVELRIGLDHPSIRLLGYVPDLNEELLRHQVFFAPVVSGTGIKTKVLEGLACGLPLVALPAAVSGLSGQHGRDYLIAEDAEEFVRHYARLQADPHLAQELGQAGRTLVIRCYSIEAATEILGCELAAMFSTAGWLTENRARGLTDGPSGMGSRPYSEKIARQVCVVSDPRPVAISPYASSAKLRG